jgi:tetratricopeptide (TPR) repeat protein
MDPMSSPGLLTDSDPSEFFWGGADAAPEDPEALNNRGAARFASGDAAGALADFDLALRLRPQYPEALNNRGIVRHRLGDAAGALADFDSAIEFHPRYAEALANRAVTRTAVGDLAGALADFDRAVGIRPDFAEALHGRAAALRAWGDLDGAMADYGRVLGLVPPEQAAPVYHLRAAIRVAQRRFADAVAECTEALALDPSAAMAHLSRGHARYHLRDLDALADYRAAFAIDPPAAAADVVRLVVEDLADVEAVLKNCRQHVRLCPDDITAYARRGLTLLLLGREEEAARDFEDMLRRAPDWTGHLELMVRAARAHAGGPRAV